jgi:hypothetical protein
VLDPATSGGLTDYNLKMRLEKISQSGTVYLTLRQLYASYRNKYKKNSGAVPLTVAALSGVLVFFAFNPWVGAIMVILFSWAAYAESKRKPWLSITQFNNLFERWYVNSTVTDSAKTMVLGTELQVLPAKSLEQDIYDYGVEAVIVTDQDIYVDLFVKNNYHTQYKALIVSKNLYPDYLQPRLESILAKKPDLPLFFIHDATIEGMQTMEHFKNITTLNTTGHPCIDLGLTPKYFARLKPLKKLKVDIDDTYAPLDYLQHKHFTAIFNKCIVERAEQQALLNNEELNTVGAEDLTSRVLMSDLVDYDFG